jgi:hypothetical protein
MPADGLELLRFEEPGARRRSRSGSCQSNRAHLPAADRKIVFDTCHVVKHLHDAESVLDTGAFMG